MNHIIKTPNNNENEVIALQVINFSKKYFRRKNYAVHNASFEVQKGEFHGFIGANGSGKTTTIKSLIGAYGKVEGKISIFGKKHSKLESKKRIGYIPEVANFPKELNAVNYVKHMAYLSGMSLKKAKLLANKILKDMGLESIMKKKPRTFSSGEKKKILLAQALINDPDLIIMDEPAANLDPIARNDFFNTLKKLQQKGKTIFISSHILAELDMFVDSVTILDEGKIVYTGKIKNLVKNKELLKYKVTFKDELSLKKYQLFLDESQIKFQTTDNVVEPLFLKQENVDKSMDFIVKSKLALKSFNESSETLQQIYSKLIKKTSNNTSSEASYKEKNENTKEKSK